jgi:3-oxoacyl-[acyl-carrier protein] reductase
MVRAFGRAGWRVAAGVHERGLTEAGADLLAVPLDVTVERSCRAAVAAVLVRFGRLDCLVNNAGSIGDQGVSRLTEADWDRVVGVNLSGAMRCARAVLPGMEQQRSGHIINISSFAARYGTVGQAAYAAAKAGLLGLTQALAAEVGSRNVQVNAILPGVIPTPMTAQLPAARLDELARANLLGRLNSLQEVASFVAFLAGMKDVSGQVFQLDSRLARWT